jgi:Ran GTPase-activating protein (RanGAP) involved in mRNA processing and transport
LNLSKNPLKFKGAKAIGDMIMKGNDISLDFLDISDCQITHQGAVYIYQGIRRCQSLEHLVLDKNKLSAKYMPELSQAFWMNNTLLKLSMAHCELYDDGCIYLFDGIDRNLKLEELNISDNNLRFLSAKRIAEVLTVRDVCLENLNLSHNSLSD